MKANPLRQILKAVQKPDVLCVCGHWGPEHCFGIADPPSDDRKKPMSCVWCDCEEFRAADVKASP